MKLYYSPGDCSLSPHIVALESGIACEMIRVDLKSHTTQSGDDFYSINPLGYVPLLVLDNGQTLREGAAIIQYLADLAQEKELIPPAGTFARYQAQEWLNFIATEIHKSFAPLFTPTTPEAYKPVARQQLLKRYRWVDRQLKHGFYTMGETFSVVDAYLFTTVGWAQHAGLDLSEFTHLQAWSQRIASRPQVQAAMKAEGL
ncbi:glutathione transferase GstA [Cedecea neteri]|uniref:glutathione transferase GstA n=1 Tax=Cedecea neteri TaxID=158822 RepID=UPI0005D9A0AB|nr:glutathione transferase GstA [Cedecea neteri]AJZ87762.1 glutathione S-transferase [Klebsiella michiganensis]WPU22726.1 glutathione transferase GstA [Cedecea neteri]